MSKSKRPAIPDTFIEVRYLVATGGSGSERMYLSELLEWKANRPYHLINDIRNLDVSLFGSVS